MYILREYQEKAVESGLELLKSNKKRTGICVIPTGGGKSLVIASIAKELEGNTIVLQPTLEILKQNLSKMKEFGFYDIGVFSASAKRKDFGKITFATIGSIYNKKEEWDRFQNTIVDECFVAGTKVGNNNIEDLQSGDYVKSFNHRTNKIEKKKILKVSKKRIKQNLIFTRLNSKHVISTWNHPFYVEGKGYIKAKNLVHGDILYINTKTIIKKAKVEYICIYTDRNKYGQSKNSKNNFVYNIEVEDNNNYFANGILVHNCHLINSRAGMYSEFINAHNGNVLGITATPYRLHSYQDMRTEERCVVAKILTRTRPRIFKEIIHITQVEKLYEQKYLCPIKYVINKEYNHSDIALNSTGMDFNQERLKEYNEKQNIVEIISNLIKEQKSKHILVFNVFVSEAEALSESLKNKKIKAETISSNTSSDERERIINDFKSGKIKVVTNVGVLTLGFDFPELDCVILARPTQSVVLYSQMIGRAIRISKNKEYASIIDMCGNVERFGKVETFQFVAREGNKNKIRLRSNKGYLTGYDFVGNSDIEENNYLGLEERIPVGPDIISFGKYKGTHIKEISLNYLEWCVETFNDGKYKKQFQKELQRRLIEK